MNTLQKTLLITGTAAMLGATLPTVMAATRSAGVGALPTEVHAGSIQIGPNGPQLNQAMLAAKARIEPGAAIATARQAMPGKVIRARLDDENGYLIWSVGIVTPNGDQHDLKIDAGNGKLLAADSMNSASAEREGDEGIGGLLAAESGDPVGAKAEQENGESNENGAGDHDRED